MDFIFIQGLWLLPIASIPFIINIFNNRKFKVLKFSTVRFIESLKSDSIKKINLLNLILLLLRMLMILFLILAISRPIINSNKSNALDNDSSTKIVILVDDSYSNLNEHIYRDQSKKIHDIVEKIIGQYKSAASIDVATINNGLLFSGKLENFYVDKLTLRPTYKNGNMWDLMSSYFNKINSNNYANGDMYVITDMDESSFSGIEKEFWWNIGFININSENKTPAISDIFTNQKIIFPDDHFDVIMTIVNDSDTYFNENSNLLTAYLHFGENNSIPLKFDIAPNSTRNIIFKGVSISDSNVLSGSLSVNDEDLGDKKITKANILTKINIGVSYFLNEDTKNFISKASESIRESRVIISETDLSTNLDIYDVLIIDDINHLQKYNIVQYLSRGGHIVVFQSESSNVDDFAIIDGVVTDIKFESDRHKVKKDDVLDFNFTKQVFKYNSDNILFEISNYKSLPLNSNTIIKANNRSIWNRYYIDTGLVDFLGLNLSIKNNNFAISPSFIPFFYNLIISNIKKEEMLIIEKSLTDDLNVAKESFPMTLFKDSIEVDNFDFYDKKINLSRIDSPGYYELFSKKDSGRKIKSYIANIDPHEIKYKELNFRSILSLLNENVFKYDYQVKDLNKFEAIISDRLKGVELWHFCLLISVILFILESFIVAFYHRRL